jgi:hypothetical protein
MAERSNGLCVNAEACKGSAREHKWVSMKEGTAMSKRRVRIAPIVFAGSLALSIVVGPSTGAVAASTPLPAQVFAPYFETWTRNSITSVAQRSGARYFTLAFLETLGTRSCTLAWNGERTQRLSSGRYVSDIASLRSIGGDVIPSFGGWSADQGGTEIAESCKDVDVIAAAYESVVKKYGVTRLDMDVEGRSLKRTAGIDRRNRAIKLLQDWAVANGRTVQVQFTLPTLVSGLEADALAVLQNAVTNGVRIDLVNPMVFDYYDGVTSDMGAAAISALQGVNAQLQSLFPTKTPAELWAMQSATIMNGLDDYPGRTEVTELADAHELLDFADVNGMSALSMWAIQRDNGGCPGTTGANDCSGLAQHAWDFTDLLKSFTSPGTPDGGSVRTSARS